MTATSANPSPSTGIASVVDQLRDERRWLALLRLHFGVLVASWLLLLAWVIPGTPLSAVPDYSAAMVLGLILALVAAGATLAFFAIWRPSFRGEPLSEFVSVVSGSGRLIRRRKQFEARLRLECRKARPDDAFSLLVVELASPMTDRRGRSDLQGEDPAIQAVLVRSVARTDDVVAEVRPAQVWVLAVGADEAGRALLEGRLRRALLGSTIPGTDGARIGGATFRSDATTPNDLLALAHERLTSIAADQPEAA